MLDLPELPLSAYRADFLAGLRNNPLLLEAEPGAGKSTLAPLWALEQAPVGQAVWVIQPRVLAARALAMRLAQLLGETCGQRVGYQVPFENSTSSATRLLLMTPGILLQHLLRDPTLDGVAVVMLDEIHERAVNQDLAWAWLQEVQILRDDLQLVLMSATPDPALQRQLPQRLFAAGRCFPVTTSYQPAKQPTNQSQNRWPEKLPEQLLRALAAQTDWQSSTTLVFLPGWRDIEDCAQALQANYSHQKILRLHSRVPANEQVRALDPNEGPRIILSTNIAETSLTIADVTLVIDSGLVRRAEFEQRTGINRLRTARISQASADQRRGRAGRVQAGHCIRLWSQDQPLAAADLPEIRTCDYLPLALRIAHWGSTVAELNWLESPNRLALQQAQQQLQLWQLLDDQKKITPTGQQVSELGTHPRVAVLLQNGMTAGAIPHALMLLALALHFELEAGTDIDAWLAAAETELRRNSQWRRQQKRWLAVLMVSATNLSDASFSDTSFSNSRFSERKRAEIKLAESAERLLPVAQLARAFNDRIGFRQDSGRYRLNSGISVEPLHRLESQWAVFPLLQPKPKGHTGLGLALELSGAEQKQLSQCETQFIFKSQRWQQQLTWRMGGVVIAEAVEPLVADAIPAVLIQQLREHIAQRGLDALHWPAAATSLLARARLLAMLDLLAAAPDLSEEYLTQTLDQWLQPFLAGQTKLEALPLLTALEFYLGYDNCQKIAALLPEKIALPSGRSVALTFSSEGVPEISAKLQEFFGCEQLQLAGGKIPLRIHLLSPNGSPLAITTNLQTFWQQGYPETRKEMRGRYPRHPWPENPLEHIPTALTKRRLQQSPPG
jgi:ATP-dependent helicase HrpB